MNTSKVVYGLFFETKDVLTVFYIGCTNDISRRHLEHKRNSIDTKSAEYDTYKYRFIRDLASIGIDFRLEVLTPAVDLTDRADEYSLVLKFAEHNRDNGITFYDGLPLTNMKAGDFLEEMLANPAVRTPSEIRNWRKSKAELIKQIRYDRNSFGAVSKEAETNKVIFDNLKIELIETRTEQVMRELEKSKRDIKKQSEIAKVWAERKLRWEETGQMYGVDYK